jgi:uncharacterized protein (DUF1015 family)
MTSGYAPGTIAATPACRAEGVRPFAGWLVRAEAAGEEVDAMVESAGVWRSAPRAVRPEAYEPMPPALYVYRQSTPHGEHTGIVCDITPEAFLDGRVLGHESVHPDRVDGLARYLATTPQRVQLVSTLHRAGPAARATLALVPQLAPDRDVTGPDGARHRVWRVPHGPQTERLCRELGAATHYIADGHHRVAAALDVSLLHALVLDRLPAGTRIEPVRELTEVLVAACDADGGVLFVPPAPDLDTIIAIADDGEVVPAKSTFFSPKPASGVFLRGP